MGEKISRSAAGGAVNLNGPAGPRREMDIPVRVASYAELVKAVRLAKAEGRTRAEEAVERERVRTAWEIGKLIDEHVLQHQERADYAQYVLPKLARDLAMDRSELYRMLEFARAYPIVGPARQLSWSAYESLLAVNDPGEREAIAKRAEAEGWKRDRLRKEVRLVTRNASAGGKADEPAGEKLSLSQPGKPGAYRIILAKAGPYAGKRAIDLGFSNYYRPAGEFRFKEGEILTAGKKGTGMIFSKSSQSPNDLFTYEAYVFQVLDGDTVTAVVDLGFGFVTTQTLRLRGIDAPEIMTADGMEAKKALERMLNVKGAGVITPSTPGVGKRATPGVGGQAGVSNRPVLIKTVKSDKYDRYLADIFVADVYVNQQLVEKGFAVVVEK